MKLTARQLDLHYHHEFRIARGGSRGTRTLLVELSHDGLTGRGEAAPVSFYGWTMESMAAAVEAMGRELAGADPAAADQLGESLRERYPAQQAAVAAVDGALWDLAAQRLGAPLFRLLGLDPWACGLTSFTIGIAPLEEMLAKAAEAAEYPILKVKCGGGGDLAMVKALREATGKRLWVDANGGWQPAEAADLAGALADLGVELIEQPVPREDIDGLARVQAASPLPVVADESCHGPADAVRLKGAVAGVNVKLEKVGGIGGALRTIHTARACGLRVMLGCFCASSVSLTMAAHLAPLADWCDLDGHLLVADDPFLGMVAPSGRILLPAEPGLGVRPR